MSGANLRTIAHGQIACFTVYIDKSSRSQIKFISGLNPIHNHPQRDHGDDHSKFENNFNDVGVRICILDSELVYFVYNIIAFYLNCSYIHVVSLSR